MTQDHSIGQPHEEAVQGMEVAHRLQQYGEAMRSWRQRVGTEVNDKVVAIKASTTFGELVVAANKARDLKWQAAFRKAIADAGLPPVPLCVYDTDMDGDCHICTGKGGCVPHGGPLVGLHEPKYASPTPGPQGDPL